MVIRLFVSGFLVFRFQFFFHTPSCMFRVQADLYLNVVIAIKGYMKKVCMHIGYLKTEGKMWVPCCRVSEVSEQSDEL